MHPRLILIVAFILMKITSASACTKYLTATTSYKYETKSSTSNNGFCTWFINPTHSTGYYLEIYWSTFSVVGMMPECDEDYVEVFVTSLYRSLGKYCTTNMGGSKPTYMYSFDGRMKIQYNSHKDVNLSLRYRLRSISSSYLGSPSSATCSNTNIVNRAGYVYSSGYPKGYKSYSVACYHKITAGENKETRIVFMDLSLNYNVCGTDDHVAVRGSDYSTATYSTSIKAGTRCRSTNMIVTRKKYIFVRFSRKRGSTTKAGFMIGYMIYDAQPKIILTGTCTFSADNCGLIEDATDHFSWGRATTYTSSSNTGPSVDHTYGISENVGYMYIEASSPRKENETARMSKSYTGMATGGNCLSFWYHMYGINIGKLNVYSKATMQTSLGTPRWTMVGEHGDHWRKGEFTVLGITAMIVFEGVIGSGSKGDIAIDDILMSNGPCTADVCNFEKNQCGFTYDITGSFNWLLDKGGTSTSLTGPSFDHTLGTAAGYYMYIESSSPQTVGQQARIFKRYTGLMTGGSCLSFWYHMYGSQTGSLDVYVKDSATSSLGTAKWNLIGQQGNVWKNASITIYGNTVTVVFEGVIGTGYKGDIAIDDIVVDKGASCSNEAITTIPLTTTITTTNGTSGTIGTSAIIGTIGTSGSGSKQQKNPVSDSLLKTIVISIGAVVGLAFILTTACLIQRSRRKRRNDRNGHNAVAQDKSEQLYTRDLRITAETNSNKRPLPEKPPTERLPNYFPHIEFSDRGKQSLQGAAPSIIQDDIRNIMKQQSMEIANTHSNPDFTCSMKAQSGIVSWPSLFDPTDGAAVNRAASTVANGDYIEIKEDATDTAKAFSIYEEIEPIEPNFIDSMINEAIRKSKRKGRSISVDTFAPSPSLIRGKPRSLTVDEAISGGSGNNSPFLDHVRRKPTLDSHQLPPATTSHEKPNMSQRKTSLPLLPSSFPSTIGTSGMPKNRKFSAPKILATSSPFYPHLEETEDNYLAPTPSQISIPPIIVLQPQSDMNLEAPISEKPPPSVTERAQDLPPEDYLPSTQPTQKIQEEGSTGPTLPAEIYVTMSTDETRAHDGNEGGLISNTPPYHSDYYLPLLDVKDSSVGSIAAEDVPAKDSGRELTDSFQMDGGRCAEKETASAVCDSQV